MCNPVLIISPFFSPNTGGVETHLDDLANEFSNRRMNAIVSTYKPLAVKKEYKFFERRGYVSIFRAPNLFTGVFDKIDTKPFAAICYLFPILFLQSFLLTLFNFNKISVIHSHGLTASLIARILSWLFGIDYIVSTHAIYEFNINKSGLVGKIIYEILACSRKIFCLSNQSSEQLIKLGIPEEKISVYCYWVDQTTFYPGCFKSDNQILFVGRLLEKKGVIDFVELAKLNLHFNFSIIGTGPLIDFVVESANRNSNLIYHGEVQNDLIQQYYSNATLVIIPSKYEEGMARVKMEALSCGTPVLVTDYIGLLENLTSSIAAFAEPNLNSLNIELNKFTRNLPSVEECRAYAEVHFSSRNADVFFRNYLINDY